MNRRMLACLLPALALSLLAPALRTRAAQEEAKKKPIVVMETSLGNIRIELDPEKAPITAKNFLEYVQAKHYDGLIFHRVIPTFMIQGGGFDGDFKEQKTREPIKNEAGNGLKNVRGSIAMARTNVVDSATAQFFINVVDNDRLNHRDETPAGFGYAVFGRVIEGMETVDKIRDVKTGTRGFHENVPVEAVTIKKAYVQSGVQKEAGK